MRTEAGCTPPLTVQLHGVARPGVCCLGIAHGAVQATGWPVQLSHQWWCVFTEKKYSTAVCWTGQLWHRLPRPTVLSVVVCPHPDMHINAAHRTRQYCSTSASSWHCGVVIFLTPCSTQTTSSPCTCTTPVPAQAARNTIVSLSTCWCTLSPQMGRRRR